VGGCACGVKFRLYPKPPYAHPDWAPETVIVSGAPTAMGPGPSDDRMYVINPVNKRVAYGALIGPLGTPYTNLPPWTGPIHRPVRPDAGGHFDYLPEDAPEFVEAHVFGAVRFVLDIWEGFFGRRIEWHFAHDYPRLEIVISPWINNSYAGYGYLEVGADHTREGTLRSFALNFDVVAHELGHLIIYSTIGVPSPFAQHGEYYGFQESAADTVAMVSVLHFDSLIDHLLEETHGNLYTFNELDRFAEMSAQSQIRVASNDVKLSRFSAGWEDEHALSEPLTGAMFDIIVDIYQELLVEREVIGSEIAEATRRVRRHPENAGKIQLAFDAAYVDRYEEFRAALIEARDYMGLALSETWKRLSADFFTYLDVAKTMIEVDAALSGGRYRRAMVESFDWREIGRVTVGPRLKPPGPHSHSHSARTLVPGIRTPNMSYREQAIMAGLAL
jgi:hypothetical protein